MSGNFTKEEIIEIRKYLGEMFIAIKPGLRSKLVGRLNDIYLFLSAAEKVAPNEKGG